METSTTMYFLFGLWAFITGIIYVFTKNIKYGTDFYNMAKAYPEQPFPERKLLNIASFVVLVGIIYGLIGSIASMTGLEITGKQWIELTIPVFIIGTVSIGLTMILINTLPVMMRTFENTIGFSFINKGSELNTIITDIIDTSKNNVIDYTVLATQLYIENFKAYLGSMLPNISDGASISRFTNVFVKKDIFENGNLVFENSNGEQTSVGKLLDKIIEKRVLSETTWISLGALFTILGSYYYTA
jgi:hypothetical protein